MVRYLKKNKPKLLIDWATHEATKYACEKWHYAGVLPTGKLVKIGVWENDKFIGVVIYSRGASPYLPHKYGLNQTECCELTRVALTRHITEVTRIISISIKFLRRFCPGIKMIVSFADPMQGHTGGIYKGGNWKCTGTSNETTEVLYGGRWRHMRGVYHKYKNSNGTLKTRKCPGKLRFIYLLKCATSIENDATSLPAREGRCDSDRGAPENKAVLEK